MGDLMGPQIVPPYLYVSLWARDDHVIALESLLQSFNPGRPTVLLNVKRSELSFDGFAKRKIYKAQISGVAEIVIRRQLDVEDKPLMRTLAIDYFSNTLEYAQNITYKAWGPDGKLKWDYSGWKANYRQSDGLT
jgi:hypothetical protein